MAVHKKYNTSHGAALGRGIDAIFNLNEVQTDGSSLINELSLDDIEPNPNQPRREFSEESLGELAASISEVGIVQPITVRQTQDGRYQIIAGERRWRAARMAGLDSIPAYIRTIADENIMEMALVENIQREDLNAIEIALAYEQLLGGDGMTQEKVSERVGKSRAAITNYLRLLRLPAPVQLALQKKEIDMGHARALLAVDDPKLQLRLFKEIQKHGYSVRKVEEMAQSLKNGEDIVSGTKHIAARHATPEAYKALGEQLSSVFSTRVKLNCTQEGKGKISIPFASTEELEKIIAVFDKLKAQN